VVAGRGGTFGSNDAASGGGTIGSNDIAKDGGMKALVPSPPAALLIFSVHRYCRKHRATGPLSSLILEAMVSVHIELFAISDCGTTHVLAM